MVNWAAANEAAARRETAVLRKCMILERSWGVVVVRRVREGFKSEKELTKGMKWRRLNGFYVKKGLRNVGAPRSEDGVESWR